MHPAPALHTATEWLDVTAGTRQHMQRQANGSGAGVKIPSAAELDEIAKSMATHADGSH